MSDNEFFDELEGLIGKHREKVAAVEQDKATEERFKRIEDSIAGIGSKIDEHFSSTAAADTSESSAAEKGEGNPSGRTDDSPPANDPPDDNLDIERVTRSTVPRIYAGDDEPEIVKYIDADDGEIKTRKGRRKNYPTQTMVDVVMPEPENRPQEPEADAV